MWLKYQNTILGQQQNEICQRRFTVVLFIIAPIIIIRRENEK